MDILSLPEFKDIQEKYSEEHFMRIQAYFYLWKNTVSEVSLKALNETLIKVRSRGVLKLRVVWLED